MTPRVHFAAYFIVGVMTGLALGAMLPWWMAGAPAWVLAAATTAWVRSTTPHPLTTSPGRFAPLASPRLSRDIAAHVSIVRAATWGAFIGGCIGGLAATLPQVWAALGLTDATWPMHGPIVALIACACVAVDAYVTDPALDAAEVPGFVPWKYGLTTYLAYAAVAFLPALAEVWP